MITIPHGQKIEVWLNGKSYDVELHNTVLISSLQDEIEEVFEACYPEANECRVDHDVKQLKESRL